MNEFQIPAFAARHKQADILLNTRYEDKYIFVFPLLDLTREGQKRMMEAGMREARKDTVFCRSSSSYLISVLVVRTITLQKRENNVL